MKSKPILFSGSMVRAILAGKKHQTRRVINRLSGFGPITEFRQSTTRGYDYTFRDRRACWNDLRKERVMDCCPHGQAGDELWCREAWNVYHVSKDEFGNAELDEPYTYIPQNRQRRGSIEYRADDQLDGPWRPSIHMPRWASRITLMVTDVRVERLQEISDRAAIAEGIESTPHGWRLYGHGFTSSPIASFRSLWELINGAGSWEQNSWVWVISFERVHEKNTNQ
jgi:hypothetical protein